MSKSYKKTVSLIISAFFLGIFAAPTVFAENECDNDGDGYIVIPLVAMQAIDEGTTYDPNGEYSAFQWEGFFTAFKNAQDYLLDEEKCIALNFKNGAEPSRCDKISITAQDGVFDPAKVSGPLSGKSFNPGAFDQPDNGIDENCDGKDATLIATTGDEQELGGLVDKVIVWLSRAVVVVSIIILIWGGMLYATAAGDEQRTAKARKAIIGAIIGLIVGLLAPTVVNWITASLA